MKKLNNNNNNNNKNKGAAHEAPIARPSGGMKKLTETQTKGLGMKLNELI